MKLTLKHSQVRSTDALDTWVEEQILSLQPLLQIDEANVTLAYDGEASPAFGVKVHLATPGPDVVVEAHDHTFQAAFHKVMVGLRVKISSRATRKQKRQRNPEPLMRVG